MDQPDSQSEHPGKSLLEDDLSLAQMAQALVRSGDYKVLRRLKPRSVFCPSDGKISKTAVILDVETTGLDANKDEVIELGMVKFDYLPDGRITNLRGTFAAFNEPSGPIPQEVIVLTGITDAMVRGHQIDGAAVDTFVADAAVVIAHNAAFDRKFAERNWPVFEQKAWGCSATEIEWKRHGFHGARLDYLLNGAGFFHQAHRAVDDCHALLEVLAFELPTTGGTALTSLLDQARKRTMRIWAEQTPFDLKDTLKRRGYRWSDGSDGRPRSWYVDIEEDRFEDEILFLRAEIYLQDFEPRFQIITATSRFSVRA